MATAHSCQAAALQERGLVARATFIDGPAEWFDLSGSSRRAHSSPPATSSDGEVGFGMWDAKGTPRGGERPALPALKLAGGAKARESSPSAQSEASSTTYASLSQPGEARSPQVEHCTPHSDSDAPSAESPEPAFILPNEGDLWWLSTEAATACKDRARELVSAVERGCGFLKLNGHAVHAHSSDRARRQGMAVNLRFYVRGLPSAKRAKWQQPLYWSVATVLRRLGIDLRMQGGELHLPVQKDIFIRLEFVAGRL